MRWSDTLSSKLEKPRRTWWPILMMLKPGAWTHESPGPKSHGLTLHLDLPRAQRLWRRGRSQSMNHRNLLDSQSNIERMNYNFMHLIIDSLNVRSTYYGCSADENGIYLTRDSWWHRLIAEPHTSAYTKYREYSFDLKSGSLRLGSGLMFPIITIRVSH